MSHDSTRSAATEVLFILLGLLGLVGTWAQAFGYLEHGVVAGNVLFWREALATPASTFITVDILVLAAALFVWLFAEGRRIGIGGAWLWGYFLGSLFVGISCAVPLFLAHRQRRLRLQRPDEVGRPAAGDRVAIAAGIVIALVAVIYSLRHAA